MYGFKNLPWCRVRRKQMSIWWLVSTPSYLLLVNLSTSGTLSTSRILSVSKTLSTFKNLIYFQNLIYFRDLISFRNLIYFQKPYLFQQPHLLPKVDLLPNLSSNAKLRAGCELLFSILKLKTVSPQLQYPPKTVSPQLCNDHALSKIAFIHRSSELKG